MDPKVERLLKKSMVLHLGVWPKEVTWLKANGQCGVVAALRKADWNLQLLDPKLDYGQD